jgi:hypothetical protein
MGKAHKATQQANQIPDQATGQAGDVPAVGWMLDSDLSPDTPISEAELDAIALLLGDDLRRLIAG